jgi:hypothetical protein
MNRTCVVVTLVLNGVVCFVERWRKVDTKKQRILPQSVARSPLLWKPYDVSRCLVQWPQSPRLVVEPRPRPCHSRSTRAFTRKGKNENEPKGKHEVMAAARAKQRTMSRSLRTSPAAGRLSCGPGSSCTRHVVERESERFIMLYHCVTTYRYRPEVAELDHGCMGL